MNGTQSCIAAYVVGLALILGYAMQVWIGCRTRRPVRQPPAPCKQLHATVVIGARKPSRSRPA